MQGVESEALHLGNYKISQDAVRGSRSQVLETERRKSSRMKADKIMMSNLCLGIRKEEVSR